MKTNLLKSCGNIFLTVSAVVFCGAAANAYSYAGSSGEDIAKAKCTKCHNNDDKDTPRLNAQTPQYLYQSMLDYKSGVRHSDDGKMLMKPALKGINDEGLKAVSEYFSHVAQADKVAGDPALSAKGKEIYFNGIPAKGVAACASCHGNTGEGRGNGDNMNPRVAGQYIWFVNNQLINYRDKFIVNDAMAKASAQLSNDEIKALANFIQGM